MNIMRNRVVLFTAVCAVFFAGLTGCVKKEFDAPEISDTPIGTVITIDSLKSMYMLTDLLIEDTLSIYATVTADETTGNLYKTSYVQDSTGAICLTMPSSGGLYKNDSVRISLFGCTLTSYGGAIQLEMQHVDTNIIKQFPATVEIQPQLVTLNDLLTGINAYDSKLIRVNDVEFSEDELGNTYADADGQQSMDRVLRDCNGLEAVVRSSGYANFADVALPGGKGSIVAIASQYNGTIQLLLRTPDEVKLDSNRCDGSSPNVTFLMNKNFEDGSIVSGGWSTQLVAGTTNWTIASFSGNYLAKIANYTSSTASDCWLISPSLDLSGTTSPILSFLNICNYTGADLELYISTDYDGTSLPATASWTQTSFALSTGAWAEVNSGNIDLSPYKQSNVHIAFRYQGVASGGKTWELDNIKIKDTM